MQLDVIKLDALLNNHTECKKKRDLEKRDSYVWVLLEEARVAAERNVMDYIREVLHAR